MQGTATQVVATGGQISRINGPPTGRLAKRLRLSPLLSIQASGDFADRAEARSRGHSHPAALPFNRLCYRHATKSLR
jgi:hypothetical protein